jgi:dienelactone hydrolase
MPDAFAYDAEVRLEMKERARRTAGTATVRDVELAGPDGSDDAFLIEPAAGGGGPGVMFLHWFDDRATDGNREEFVDEAVELAGRGVVSLLPQGVFPWKGPPTDAVADTRRIADQVVRQRRYLDLLMARPDVDAERVALVGHDFGGMHAAILASIDRRAAAVVLIAAVPRWGDWFLPFWQIEGDRYDYLRALGPYDPITHVAKAAPAPLLFQFARNDHYIAPMTGGEFLRAASEPKALKAYDTDHAMRDPAARADRLAFLSDALRLHVAA